MENINYSLEYIKEFIKKKCDLIWDYAYFDYNSNKTKKVNLETLRELDLDLVVRRGGHVFLQPVLINNNTFKLYEKNETKDYSYSWQTYVEIENHLKKEQELITK